MDENEFRAEIAEIFREQDRRFDRAQKRMEETSAEINKLKTALDGTNASLEKTAKIANANAKAIDKLSSLWGDFVDVYRFREHQTEKTLSNLSVKISEIDNRTR